MAGKVNFQAPTASVFGQAVKTGEEEIYFAKPTDFVKFAITVRVTEDGKPPRMEKFSFDERPYLLPVYNTPRRRVLLKCGRQVEKCLSKYAELLDFSGKPVLMKDVRVGDRLLGMASDEAHTEVGTVTWKSDELLKPCVKIRTRQGHETVVALTHPMRKWGSWPEAGDLKVKDRLAVVRQAGEFTGTETRPDWELKLLGYMVAEGYMPTGHSTFTQSEDGPVLWEFIDTVVDELGDEFSPSERRPGLWMLRFGRDSDLQALVQEWGLEDTRSATKFVPDFVYGLDQRQTALFLNRLWAGDGHCSLQGSSYHIEYDSTSERLARDVQRLLWKFGIPTSFRRWKPRLYEGTDKWAYKLRVETAEGVRRFLTDIGALGKTEDLPLPGEDFENNNRDTYPLEIAEDIKEIHRSRPGPRRGRYVPQPSLRSSGLRETPKYPLSRDKLQQYVDFFQSDERFDQEKVLALSAHLDTDLYWDEIVEIEDLGEQPCYDITVEGTDSFIGDGFITHNSTSLGNISLAYACILPGFQILFVSPSQDQTRTFSRDRLKDPMETSDELKVWTDMKLADSISLKQFLNRSKITLRYAFHNADRTRGIPADMILLDEIQDIYVEHIPVILECASHSPYKIYRFSGTPKSLDNTLEYYWANYSTQNEWVVPCEHHVPWHWNVLDERNIGKKGLICDKCGNLLNPAHPKAQWASMNRNPRTQEPYEGFRIPQLMVPWIAWTDILDKYESYSRAKFNNEVLGLSFDSGSRPLTQQDVMDNCNPVISLHDKEQREEFLKGLAGTPIYAGVDWGSDGESSHTVLSLGAYIDGKFTIFFVHRFTGPEADPEIQLGAIKKIINAWKVRRVGVDYGGGFWPNDELIRSFGTPRIQKFQYLAPRAKVEWDEKLRRWKINRSEVMSDIFNAIKRRDVFQFPCWEDFAEPYARDMLNIFSEYNEQRRMNQYKHSPGTSDDTFHSITYCFLASMIDLPRPDIIAPNQERRSA